MGKQQQEDVKPLHRVMINFPDRGIAISASSIVSIEKDLRYKQGNHSNSGHWEYGIVLNKGVEVSQYVTKTDIEIWWNDEEYRDKRYETILECLEDNGMKIINVF